MPKTLFTNAFPTIGLPAKVLYAMILDRLSLSEKNNWKDPNRDTFALFSREEMARFLGVSRPTATKALGELKAAGLIREVSQGKNRPTRLYIEGKNLSFTAEAEGKEVSLTNDPEGKNFSSEGKIFSSEGKEFAPSNLKEQLNLVTLKKESTAPSCAVAEPSNAVSISPDRQNDEVPYEQIVELYLRYCPCMPKVGKIREETKKKIRARWQECQDLDAWTDYFKKAGQSDFLNGRSGKNYRANFTWLLSRDNMAKVLDGRYDNDDYPYWAARERQIALDAQELQYKEVT